MTIKFKDYTEADSKQSNTPQSESNYFDLKQGETIVRFLPLPDPSEVSSELEWPSNIWVETFRHYVPATFAAKQCNSLCPQKMANAPCPICSIWHEAEAKGHPDAEKLKPARKFYANAIVRKSPDGNTPSGIVILKFGAKVRDRLQEIREGAFGRNFPHPLKGYDISVVRSGQGMTTVYSTNHAPEASRLAETDDEIVSLINGQRNLTEMVLLPSFEDIEAKLHGMDTPRPVARLTGGSSSTAHIHDAELEG